MKTTIQILFLVLLYLSGSAQTFDDLTGEMRYDTDYSFFRDGDLFLTDSTFNYVIDTTTGVADSVSKSINLSFNNYGRIIESIAYSKALGSSLWVEAKRTVYTYDEEGGLLELHDYVWDDSISEWKNLERRFFSPEEYGSASTVVQKWDETMSTWRNVSRQFAGFINLGKPEYQWREKWDTLTGSWEKEWRLDFAYDVEEKLKAQLFSKWDSLRWANHNQSFYFYDTDGNIKSKFINAWYSGDWHKIAKLTYEDNIYNQWQVMTHYIWNDVDSLWGVYKMEERQFGDNEKLTFHAHKTWVVDHWQYTFGNFLEYDENDNTVNFELQKYNNGEWRCVSGSKFFVSNHGDVTGIPIVENLGFTYSFSNPYKGEPVEIVLDADIDNFQVRLYDINGRLHFQKRINSTTSFGLGNNLADGMYLLVFDDNGRILASEKIIIVGN